MAKIIRIRSKTDKKLGATLEGAQFVLNGREERSFPLKVAQLFLSKYPGQVAEAEASFGKVADAPQTPRTYWVANMTGNPELPDTVTIQDRVKGTSGWHQEWIDVANEIRAARDLVFWMQGPMKEFNSPTGVMARNMPATKILIPPYQRVEVDSNTGLTISTSMGHGGQLTRDHGRLRAMIESRPPAEFEPVVTMPLDELRCYLKLCDAEALVGPSEADLKHATGDVPDETWEQVLYDAKFDLLRRIYFRLVDPAIPLPSRLEFAEVVSSFTGKPPSAPVAGKRRGAFSMAAAA